jgi:putative flippase GtrA
VNPSRVKVPFWKSFGRAQIASLIGSASDMGVMFALVELLGVWYVLATALGAFTGAVVNFLLGRHWSFEAQDRPPQGQALRYAVVSAGSLLLNAGGVYAITEWGGLKYGYSKLIVSLLVGFFFNFPLQRHYVFK